MTGYLNSLKDLKDIDLNAFLVIDRFRWENTSIDVPTLLLHAKLQNKDDYYNYLKSFLKTELQIRNLDLVWEASYNVLCKDKRL